MEKPSRGVCAPLGAPRCIWCWLSAAARLVPELPTYCVLYVVGLYELHSDSGGTCAQERSPYQLWRLRLCATLRGGLEQETAAVKGWWWWWRV